MTRLGWVASIAALLVIATLPARATDEAETAYLTNCAGCHGTDGGGTSWAPPISDAGAAGVDFSMRTGRMPLRAPTDPIRRREPVLTDQEVEQITRFAAGFDGPQVPDVDPSAGDPAEGSGLYLLDCAACHGATGVGGALVGARNAPSILSATPLEIAEAIRSGPGPMPSFDQATLDDTEMNSIVRYVLDFESNAGHGGWSLGSWGPVAEGAAAWLVGIAAAIGAAYWIEGRSRVRPEEVSDP
jgi:ubiquinol-cytochrome c reductase cytochrome c subunit